MSSSKNLRRKNNPKLESESQSDNMKDFIDGPNIKFGYEGASDSNDEQLNNCAPISEAPKIEQKKVEIKVSTNKIQALFADNIEEENSDDELAELIARKLELEKRSKMILEDNLDVSKLPQILQSSKAKAKPIVPTHKSKDAINFSNRILTTAEAQSKFKNLPNQVQIYITEIYQNHTDKKRLFAFGVTTTGERMIIQIKDVDKCLYFIMKPEKTDEDQIEDQIRNKLKEAGIEEYDGEFVKMNYVFEIEGVPRGQINTYRVRYPFALESKNSPKPDWEGETFKYVIGTTYSPLQLFVVKNNIKGPQWVTIEKKYFELNTKLSQVTGLSVNLVVPETLSHDVRQKQLKIPKLRAASISLKVTKPCEVRKNIFPTSALKQKPLIYCITLEYCPNYNIQSKTKGLNLQSIIFCLSSLGHPDVKGRAVKIIKCENEIELLVRFFDVIEGYDPDIIACHDATLILDTIVSRAESLNVKHRSKLSRLGSNRHALNTGNLKNKQMWMLAGRLLVDTYFHAKDLVKSVDYSLPFISNMLPIGKVIQDIRSDQANLMLANEEWSKLAIHCLEQSNGTFQLMNHLEIVQLSRQLTNICGNLWRRSLDNARAERNQYLMMHECQAQNIIIPDKFYREKDEEGVKKEKYEGGYVLQPEKDLYTEFILLLDFNSLYPSIIRQYNICFSKVKRNLLPLSYYYKSKEEGKKKQNKQEQQTQKSFKVEAVSEQFRAKQNWGFLPKLIHAIVDKRKEYKKKMAMIAGLSKQQFERRQDEYLAHEITQKSYKLVANSIYGCLGFDNSRYYARDLAALITEKGRDALKRAKELVEKQKSSFVIYGDTDSLMIRIDMEEGWNEVQKIKFINEMAQKMRKIINNEYKNGMLEIDIDGVFKPLNLIAKKKYMAKKLSNFDKVMLTGAAPTYTIEYKGIEVAKRDGCEKSRKAIKDIFDIVLNNMTNVEDASTKIYDYFQRLDKQMTELKPETEYKNYVLAKTLNKHPNQYKHSAENLPHIRVAKKLIENGEKAQKLINHAIYYVIVESDKEKASVADRAVDEISYLRSLKTISPMKIDINYYKVHEILPPIIRILVNVKSINKSYINQKFRIPKSLHKEVENMQFDGEERQFDATEYQAVTTDFDSPLNSIFPEVECPGYNCTKKYPIIKNGILLHECKNNMCEFNKVQALLPVVSNILSNYMFIKSTNFYTPEYKCRECNKIWRVQVKECCEKSKFDQNSNSSELHNTLYLIIKILKKMQGQLEFKTKKSHVLTLLNEMNTILQNSDFEKVEKRFMKSLKLVK